MFNPDSWQSHTEYRINFKNLKARFPSQLRIFLWDHYSKEREKLMSLNLDLVGEYLSQYYSTTERPAKNQAQILRSFLLFAMLFNRTDATLSLTSWVEEILPKDSALSALIGCPGVDFLPPFGSYFDFMNRFWNEPREQYARSSLLPKGKNGKKPKKELGADGKLVEPEPDKYATKDLAESILNGTPLSNGCQDILQDIFLSGCSPAFLQKRAHPKRKPHGFRGWDSHEKNWYYGRTLYMLCCRNSDLKTELPILMNFTGAKRHDSINFLYAIDAFGAHGFGITPTNLCLDSAHDNLPTYRLLER